MHRLAILALGLALSGCCCNNCNRPTENFVADAPPWRGD